MSNERNRDFGGAPLGSDQGGAERRDPGEEALLELARLIGGQSDPFAPDASNKAEPRLADVSRVAASQADAGRDSFGRSYGAGRRDPEFGDRRVATPPIHPSAAPPGSHGHADFDFTGEPPVADYDSTDPGSRSHRGRGNAGYGHPHDEHGEYADEYPDGEYGDEFGDEFGDGDDAGGNRRRPTKVILAVVGLAVFGSAAAYGYRYMVSAPSGPAPVIHADNSPTKITPMSDVNPENGPTDRVGEQLVRRDEDPLNVPGASDAGRGNDTVSPSGDPKRVHTVPIRADQGTTNSPDRALPAVAAIRAVPPPAPAAAPPSRQAAAPPPPPPQPAPPPQQPQAALAPPPADTAMAAPESGGYLVQLTAVKNETDAQSEVRRLQAKYAAVLNGRQPMVRRKEKGEQVIYATAVGPFGGKTEADQLCEQLKAAGGSCYVYKN